MENTNHLRRRLRPFRDFIGLRRNSHARTLRLESEKPSDNAADVRFMVTGLPKDLSRDDKGARLSELSDAITNIDNSDVFVISMWIRG